MKEANGGGAKVSDKKANAAPSNSRLGVLISVLVLSLVIAMAGFIAIGPMKKYKLSKADVDSKRQQLTLAKQNKQLEEARVESQKALVESLNQRKPGFDLWGFTNSMVAEAGLKDRVKNLQNYRPRVNKPGEKDDLTMVELELSGMKLEELVNLLHKIYASNNLVVLYKSEYIRPAKNNKGLECDLIFMTPKGQTG